MIFEDFLNSISCSCSFLYYNKAFCELEQNCPSRLWFSFRSTQQQQKRSYKYLFTPVLDSADMKRDIPPKIGHRIYYNLYYKLQYLVSTQCRNNAIAKAGASRDWVARQCCGLCSARPHGVPPFSWPVSIDSYTLTHFPSLRLMWG